VFLADFLDWTANNWYFWIPGMLIILGILALVFKMVRKKEDE
jgi:hypothetical protein